jgi:tetratricopeptide (TPR) repeat protein
VQAVGGLPLALVLMGRYLRQEGRRGEPRRLEAARLRLLDPAARMDLVEARPALEAQPSLPLDASITLRTVISLSEAGLSEAARQMLAAVAVFPPKPNSFDEPAALAASDGEAPAWDALLDAGMVENIGAGRYALHPSVADYAAGLGGLAQAGPRLIDWAVVRPSRLPDDVPALGLDEANALTAMQLADEGGALLRLLDAWFEYFEAAGRLAAVRALLDRAVEAGRGQASPGELQRALELRSRARYLGGEYVPAADDARAALDLAERASDRRSECACLKVLALAARAQGAVAEALGLCERGLAVAERESLVREQAELLVNRAAMRAARGEDDAARRDYETALRLARAIGARGLEGTLLANLGVLAAREGDLGRAQAGLLEAVELAHAAGERRTLAALLLNLGALAFDGGDPVQAEVRFVEARQLAIERGDPALQAQALANLGRVVAARGALDEAEALVAEGLTHARRIGHREHLTQLLINAGALQRLGGRPAEARRSLEEARDVARAMGHARFLAACEAELDKLEP